MLRKARQDLERSGISPDEAEEAGVYSVKDAREVFPEMHAAPALVLPYYDPWTGDLMTFERGGETLEFARVRYLDPPRVRAHNFAAPKTIRYGQPAQSGVHPYFPLVEGVDWDAVAADPEEPVVITEGEKKALRACLAGVATIGLGGVYNFLRDGEMVDALDRIAWKGKSVYICYDSDAAENPDIQAAEGRLAQELSLKRGAHVFLARISAGKPGQKIGIDDLIVEKGEDAFLDVLEAAPRMRKIDSAVLSLNKDIAWIEREGKAFDLNTHIWINKADLVKGSRYSTIKVPGPPLKGGGQKMVAVANAWLTHPHAQRYDDTRFDPSTTARTVPLPAGGTAVNTWRGFNAEPGDAAPFLDLTEHVFSEVEEEYRDFPLKLLAYKFQNPAQKIPIALVLIGSQGGGKSLWARIVKEAAAPYGYDIPSKALLADFNGWIEDSLIGVIDEAQGAHITKGYDVLKSLITEKRAMLNEKYRVMKQVDTYTLYIMTSNNREVGAYAADDRRMFVANATESRELSYYLDILDWLERGDGARKVAHFLLTYDLKGWRPPAAAPLTQEKQMAHEESLTAVERIAATIRDNDAHVIANWITSAIDWAHEMETAGSPALASRAQEVLATAPRLHVRDFYTPEELALILPDIAADLYGSKHLKGHVAGEISRQLRNAGIRYLRNRDTPKGFKWRGLYRQFLVVANPDDWREPITQNEFDRAMRGFKSYAETMEKARRIKS